MAYRFLIAPNKEFIARDYLPTEIKISYPTPCQLFHKTFKDKISIVFLTDELGIAPTSVGGSYIKTDTHWSGLGAFIAYQELIKSLENDGVARPLKKEDVFWEKTIIEGDLGNKVSPKVRSLNIKGTVKRPYAKLCFNNRINVRGRINCFLHKDQTLPSCLIFGDSFSYDMLRFLKEHFSTLTFIHRAATDIKIVNAISPDIVIGEMAARFLVSPPNDESAPDISPLEKILSDNFKNISSLEIDSIRKELSQTFGHKTIDWLKKYCLNAALN